MTAARQDRRFHFIELFASVLLCLCLSPAFAIAQDTASGDSETTRRADELAKHFADTASSLELETLVDEKLTLNPTPLFRFVTGGTVFGSVYVWEDAEKRLAVLGTIGSLPIQGINTEFVELHLLKPAPIKPVTLGQLPAKHWDPNIQGLQLNLLAGAPPVAAIDRARLVQMRGLARQFSAAMKTEGQSTQLRLLPQPLYRYADSTPERDGGLFAFVWDTGTDPELVLRIEATKSGDQTRWHYQPIRFTWRELALQHNGEKVWSVEEFLNRDHPVQTTPYITGLTKPIPE